MLRLSLGEGDVQPSDDDLLALADAVREIGQAHPNDMPHLRLIPNDD